MVPKELKYTSEHEWVNVQDNRVVVGITDYAQRELGDVVFVELPGIGEQFIRKNSMATIESVKAVSEIYAPVSGEIIEINDKLEYNPEFVNQDPYGNGWIAVIEPTDKAELNELLTADAYAQLIQSE